MSQLTKEDAALVATLAQHEGFRRLMKWSEEQEQEQMKLLLRIDAYRDPDQITKLQASVLEKQLYRDLLKRCVDQEGVDPHKAAKLNEAEKRGLLQTLRARL